MDKKQPRYSKSKVEENYTNESFLIYANSYGSKHSNLIKTVEVQEVETKMITSNVSLSPKPTTSISNLKHFVNILNYPSSRTEQEYCNLCHWLEFATFPFSKTVNTVQKFPHLRIISCIAPYVHALSYCYQYS